MDIVLAWAGLHNFLGSSIEHIIFLEKKTDDEKYLKKLIKMMKKLL